jgi:hypothetical protein
MRRLFVTACCLASLASSAALAADNAPASNLTAVQIADKNVAARGGLAAWRAVSTLTMSGQLDAGGKSDTQLPFVMKLKRQHKSRLEIRFQDQTALQVYDGAQGWKVRPFLGRDDAEPYTPTEAKAAASWEELDGPLVDYASKGTKVELMGAELVEGRDTYRLRLTMKSGDQRDLWVDAKTFLEVKLDGEPRKLDGKMHKVAIFYRDYKSENGLTTPRVLETVVQGVKQTRKMNITRIVVNDTMQDALFQKPQLALAKATSR